MFMIFKKNARIINIQILLAQNSDQFTPHPHIVQVVILFLSIRSRMAAAKKLRPKTTHTDTAASV